VVEPAARQRAGVEPPAAKEAASGSGSLFDDAPSLFGDQDTKPQPVEAKSEIEATKDAEGKTGGSLFGDGASLFDTPVEEETKYKDDPGAATEEKPTDSKAETRGAGTVGETIPDGTSLFDVGEPEPEMEPSPEPSESPADTPGWRVGEEIPQGTSLFDVGEPEPAAPPADEVAGTKPAEDTRSWQVGDDIPEGQSLFDVGDRPDPAAISELATQAATDGDDPDPDPENVVEPEHEVKREVEDEVDEADEEPRPTSPGSTNTPRTDADINQAGSLFDL
jgi:hypothetical protein